MRGVSARDPGIKGKCPALLLRQEAIREGFREEGRSERRPNRLSGANCVIKEGSQNKVLAMFINMVQGSV